MKINTYGMDSFKQGKQLQLQQYLYKYLLLDLWGELLCVLGCAVKPPSPRRVSDLQI